MLTMNEDEARMPAPTMLSASARVGVKNTNSVTCPAIEQVHQQQHREQPGTIAARVRGARGGGRADRCGNGHGAAISS